jgi:hypothetical protein
MSFGKKAGTAVATAAGGGAGWLAGTGLSSVLLPLTAGISASSVPMGALGGFALIAVPGLLPIAGAYIGATAVIVAISTALSSSSKRI